MSPFEIIVSPFPQSIVVPMSPIFVLPSFHFFQIPNPTLLVQNKFDQPQPSNISNTHVNVKNSPVDEKLNVKSDAADEKKNAKHGAVDKKNNFEAFHIDNIKEHKFEAFLIDNIKDHEFEAFNIDNIKDEKMDHHAQISSDGIDDKSFILHSPIVNSDIVEYDSEELENDSDVMECDSDSDLKIVDDDDDEESINGAYWF
jgi:hypothetical protein